MKLIAGVIISAVLMSCTAPIREYLEPVPGSVDSLSVTQQDPAATVSSQPETGPGRLPINPPFLPGPSRWPGNYFIILPKQKLVGSFGYNLFSCIDNGCDTLSPEPDWEHDTRRIRTGAVGGDTVMVSSAEPSANEWLVTFRHRKTQKVIYGKTRKQAITEVFPADDLTNARKRWLDTYVFSKRGVISVESTNSAGALSSHRVRVQDSLLVTDITCGVTPLPVKPIWLHVKTADGITGFIPVRYSWTNTMNSYNKEIAPWDEDILETNPLLLYTWDENSWELINNHRVVVDMVPDQVRLSWGFPENEQTDSEGEKTRILWKYPSHTVVFMDGKVVDVTAVSQEN